MSDRTETERQILEAALRAITAHGYANLTINDVSDEFEKSPSLIYHYFDSKDELIAELYDFLSEVYFDFVREMDGEDPVERLRLLVDIVIFGGKCAPDSDFFVSIYEIMVHVPHSPILKEKYAKNEQRAVNLMADILREGMESRQIKQVDPLETAAFLSAAIDGIRLHRVLLGDDETVTIPKRIIEQWLIEPLLVENS